MIGIIDIGISNFGSLKNSLDLLKVKNFSISTPQDFEKAAKIIFPGVGNFGKAVEKLEENGFKKEIIKQISSEKEFLGICLGMQLLFENSQEAQGAKGIGALKGNVVKFEKEKIPQIGWNFVKSDYELLKSRDYYFVNSYYCVPQDAEIVIGRTFYGKEFASAIKKENLLAVQFHPEKSGKDGLQFLKRWCNC